MTAVIDHPPGSRTSRPKNRILGVVRLQFTNTQTFVWVPLLILVAAWLITLIIHWIIASAGVDSPNTAVVRKRRCGTSPSSVHRR